MIDRPQQVHTDEQLTAVTHLRVPCNEISQVMDSAISEVISAPADQGVAPAGPCTLRCSCSAV